MTLAECGILPNKLISGRYDSFVTPMASLEAGKNQKTSHLSDIILPLSAWTDEEGVDYLRAEEIFNHKFDV